jgi:hypothetical protein
MIGLFARRLALVMAALGSGVLCLWPSRVRAEDPAPIPTATAPEGKTTPDGKSVSATGS